MNPRIILLLLMTVCACGLSAQIAVGDVLINEVLYNSGTNINTSTDYEWVELYNTTGSAIDITNWELRDYPSGAYFFPSSTTIPANGYLVVTLTASASQFFDYFGVQPDVDGSTSGGGGLALSNSNDGLALFSSTAQGGVCVDYIKWGSTGQGVAGAPAWVGTSKTPTCSNNDDASIARVPNGVDGNSTAADAGSENTDAAFEVAPYTPGRSNGTPEVDAWKVPDQRIVGNVNRLPRDANNGSRLIANVPPGLDLSTFNATWGTVNNLTIRVRHHGTADTIDVSLQPNAGQSTVSAPNLVLPSSGQLSSGGNNLLSGIFHISGQLPNQTGIVVIDVICLVNSTTTHTFQVEIQIYAPEITTSPNLDDIPEAQTSQVTIAANGGATPYTWSLANEPAWVSINPTTGQLTMSPPAMGANNYTFDVTVTDDNSPGRTDTVTFDVDVVAPLDITTTTLATISVGATPAETVTVTGGTAAFNYLLVGAPGWLSIGATTGVFSGTAPGAGTFNFDVEVMDSGTPAQTDTQALALTVVDTVTITSAASLPNGGETQPYSFSFAATGGTTPYVWTATGLPAFLGLNPNSGLLSGIPTISDAGTYNFDVIATDASTPSQMDMRSCTLVIDPLNAVGGGGGGDGGGCAVGIAGPVAPLMLLGLIAWRRRKGRS